MLNMPILKFEKSCNYLTEQLTVQNNHKQLILDIISNIGLILNESAEDQSEQYSDVLETANQFLQTISSNITSIEQLNLEIKNITKELTELLTNQRKTSKTKEFYIAAFSNIKHNVIIYSKKFQEIENKLSSDNNDFNEFIDKNNFKYNFVSKDDSTNSYTYAGFSINDTTSEEVISDDTKPSNEDTSNNAITDDELLAEALLEESLTDEVLSEDQLLEGALLEEALTNETLSEDQLLEDALLEEALTDETLSENQLLEDALLEEALTDETLSEDQLLEDALLEEALTNETLSEDQLLENALLEDSLFEEVLTNDLDIESVLKESDPELSEKQKKINELTNEFKELLESLSNPEFENENTSNAVISLFKEILPNVPFSTLDNNIETNQEIFFEESEDTLPQEEFIDYSEFEDLDQFNHDFAINKHIINTFQNTTKFGFEPIDYDENAISEPEESTTNNIDSTESLIETINELDDFELFDENDDDITDVEDSLIDEILTAEIKNEEELNIYNDIESDILNEYNTFKPSTTFDFDDFTENYKPELSNSSKKAEIEFLYQELIKEPSEDLYINIEAPALIENCFEETSTELISNELESENNIINETIENNIDVFDNNKTEETTLDSDENETQNLEQNISNEFIEEDLIDEQDLVESLLLEKELLDAENGNLEIEDNIVDELLNIPDNEISEDLNDIDAEEINEEINNESANNYDEIDDADEEKSFEESISNYKQDFSKTKNMTRTSFEDKLLKIMNASEDNKTLLISERLQKIYLPYKLSELTDYLDSYPETYSSLQDVVEQEFILPFDYFKKHPSKARFTETYNLLKNREGYNFLKSVSYAFRLLKKSNLNPAIIASCKTQNELESYIYYLDSDNLNNFKFFNIIYEVNPI